MCIHDMLYRCMVLEVFMWQIICLTIEDFLLKIVEAFHVRSLKTSNSFPITALNPGCTDLHFPHLYTHLHLHSHYTFDYTLLSPITPQSQPLPKVYSQFPLCPDITKPLLMLLFIWFWPCFVFVFIPSFPDHWTIFSFSILRLDLLLKLSLKVVKLSYRRPSLHLSMDK